MLTHDIQDAQSQHFRSIHFKFKCSPVRKWIRVVFNRNPVAQHDCLIGLHKYTILGIQHGYTRVLNLILFAEQEQIAANNSKLKLIRNSTTRADAYFTSQGPVAVHEFGAFKIAEIVIGDPQLSELVKLHLDRPSNVRDGLRIDDDMAPSTGLIHL